MNTKKYRWAVLWELGEESQPVGIVLERDGHVMLDLPNEDAWPIRYRGPFQVIGPDDMPTTYSPEDAAYFDHVLIDLSRMFAIGDRGQVAHVNAGVAQGLLAQHVTEPRTRRRR